MTELQSAISGLRDRIATLEAKNKLLVGCFQQCQAENKVLIKGMRFYADRMVYRVPQGSVWKPIDQDDGAMARDILKEVTGE